MLFMFKNYFKIAWRNLWKHKLFSFINIFGLAVAMSVCMGIIMLVADQLMYDQHVAKRDRIYRVTMKPVIGEIVARQSGLKLVVGYDVLVIARPENARARLKVTRSGDAVEFRNVGNTNALLFNGRQCAGEQTDCAELPSKRIYAGNAWQLQLPATGQARFMIESDGGITVETF